MNKINRLMVLIVFFCLFLISACGGGSSTPTLQTPSPEPTTPLPSSFNLTTLETSTPKTLTFSWNKSTNANNYTLCQVDASKPNNCQILVDNVLGQTTKYTFKEIIDPSITDKNFFILANNATGATPSDQMSPELSDYIGIIGYLKASNIDENGQFGYSVSLSSDGNTLAVGAHQEDGTEVDSGAVYVFTRNLDNSWSQQAYLKASNIGSGDYFGLSVSLSSDGNTLAVGAYLEDSNNTSQTDVDTNNTYNSGAVYVFTRNSDDNNNSWSQQAYLKASNIGEKDYFGYSISLSSDGNTLAVGAFFEDSGNQISPNDEVNGSPGYNSGAVYVFTRDTDNSWSQQAYLKASNIGSGDQFGVAISLSNDGNTLAVGANSEDGNGESAEYDSGAVYVFTRDTDNSWSDPAYLKASNIGASDRFGTSVSLSNDGNTLAVGAFFEDSNNTNQEDGDTSSNYDSGAVYVFTRNPDDNSNSWLQQAYLKASNIGSGDYFGYSISLSSDGNTLAVGAYQEDSGNQTSPNDEMDGSSGYNSGAVYVFTRNTGNSWSNPAYLKASNIGSGDQFGWEVSLSSDGNTLAVGARVEDSVSQTSQTDNNSENSGAVYIF